jgi:hypothetical protein
MKLFLETVLFVRIINEPFEWKGSPQIFRTLEPAYPGLPSEAFLRYQTPDLKYYEDTTGRHDDTFDCLQYCDRIHNYLTSGSVYVHVILSTNTLNVDDPLASIGFESHIKLSADPADLDLPVTYSWIIRPWSETGSRDAIDINFVNGAAAGVYHYREGLALGDWFIREEDFDVILLGGSAYSVKLAAPVKFTLYRNLQ